MFGTKYTTVDLVCANDLMDAILDKFGKDVTTYAYDMENFRVETDVVPHVVTVFLRRFFLQQRPFGLPAYPRLFETMPIDR